MAHRTTRGRSGEPPYSASQRSLSRAPEAGGAKAGGLAADVSDPGRAYVSEPESGRVVALGLDANDRLQVVAEADVDEGARYLAAEEGRVYVATRDTVVVLDSENLKETETIEFNLVLERTPLQIGEPSALAVGGKGIFLALEGEPYVLQIGKP